MCVQTRRGLMANNRARAPSEIDLQGVAVGEAIKIVVKAMSDAWVLGLETLIFILDKGPPHTSPLKPTVMTLLSSYPNIKYLPDIPQPGCLAVFLPALDYPFGVVQDTTQVSTKGTSGRLFAYHHSGGSSGLGEDRTSPTYHNRTSPASNSACVIYSNLAWDGSERCSPSCGLLSSWPDGCLTPTTSAQCTPQHQRGSLAEWSPFRAGSSRPVHSGSGFSAPRTMPAGPNFVDVGVCVLGLLFLAIAIAKMCPKLIGGPR